MTSKFSKPVTTVLIAAAFTLAGSTANADGKSVYESVCKACHGTGVMGAPKFGDKADWGERAKQGVAVLEEHAIKGFKGKKGMMPAKGGRASLSDDDVKAAVAYMLDAAK